jgi:hypothetical protein
VGSRGGIAIALTLGIILALLLAVGLGTGLLGGAASATGTPPATAAASIGASSLPSAGLATAETTQAPGSSPAVTPGGTPAPSHVAVGTPAPSTKPTLVSMTIPHKADCNGENGTGQVGMITVKWSTTGATGVRISIDPPTAAGAYDDGYQDYLAPVTSSVVPFACGSSLQDAGGTYHLYVVTTLHTTGYYQYRYQKVYQSP